MDVVHIPYNGSASIQTALLNGSVDLIIDRTPSSKTLLAGGKVRLIGMTGRSRNPAFPDVSLVKDSQSLPDYEYTYWLGIHAPVGTPDAIAKQAQRRFCRFHG